MRAGLVTAKQDWQVWTDWYEDRLEGRVRSEEGELAYVRIENELWSQGPAAVNAEIRRRIEELEPPLEPSRRLDGPLVEIKNRQELAAWLLTQPHAVAVAIAARAALRILPVLQIATAQKGGGRHGNIVLAVFRATAVSWAAGIYPARETELDDAAVRATFAVADAVRAAADATADFAAVRAAARAASDAARVAAARAAFPLATQDAAAEAAATAASTAATITVADASDAAFAAHWSAVSADATVVGMGATASVIVASSLWPDGQKDPLQFFWPELGKALDAAHQDWDVWTNWYEDRLEGRVRNENRELAYVRIDDALWKQGPAVVNAEIKRRIEELEPTPTPIENVPSAVSFDWGANGKIAAVLGALNWPAFPFKGGEQDHRDRLDACRTLANTIVESLQRGRWNARSDYGEALGQYVAYLPKQPEEGNFLLADAEARVIRAMFAAESDSLSVGMAAKLQILLEQHIGLRAYYPQTEAFYQSVRTGHLERPLPIDAIEGFIQAVRDRTPSRFEPNVANTLENTAQPIPAIASTHPKAPKSGVPQPAPPPDPIGEVDPEKTREFTAASGVNSLWKVMTSGKKVGENIEGWKKVIETMGPYALPILLWLQHFVR